MAQSKADLVRGSQLHPSHSCATHIANQAFRGYFLPGAPSSRVAFSAELNSLWQSSYNALFSELTQAIVPIVPDSSRPAPDPVAIEVVRQELIARESKIQGQILALMPLLKCVPTAPQI